MCETFIYLTFKKRNEIRVFLVHILKKIIGCAGPPGPGQLVHFAEIKNIIYTLNKSNIHQIGDSSASEKVNIELS